MRLLCILGIVWGGSGAVHAADILQPDVRLFVDPSSTVAHAAAKLSGTDRANALAIAKFPIATWLTDGSPQQVQARVARVVNDATEADEIPVLVVYNIPFRDCQQYSSGGAKDSPAYQAWIDGVAAGIESHRAVVLLEPDGLGIIPHHVDVRGRKEWCRPSSPDPTQAANERYRLLNYAVNAFRLPNVAIYLDGTHSGWLEVGDAAKRLVRAGVGGANGFFLNVSNYRPSIELVKYGEWVAKCIEFAAADQSRFAQCRGPAPPAASNDIRAWKAIDDWYAGNVDTRIADLGALKHFVIDTSRNGRGVWTPSPNAFPDPQAWCNPPRRGLGERPTTRTEHPLLDAKLWIKVPGESDGECTRGTKGPLDPARGVTNPAAGIWFKEQAAELIRFARPPLRP